jgi:hypothetical protein
MERQKALALAAAVTCVLGSTAVAGAAVGGTSILGFGGGSQVRFASLSQSPSGGQSTEVVRRTKNVYDKFVVDTPTTPSAPSTRSTPTKSAPAPATPAQTVVPRVEPAPSRSSGGSGGGSAQVHRRHPASKPSTVRKAPTPPPARATSEPTSGSPVPQDPPTTTTAAPVTTTTRPPGVPKDWPAGKPIPPMPPNCKQPQLELNGVWNCQDD